MQLRRAVAAAAAVLLACPAVAGADGWLGMRGAWYKERGTRVVQPMVDAQLEAGPTGVVDAHFLVDAITSASSATGSTEPFTELRYEAGLGYTRLFPGWRLGFFGKFSTEEDYTSSWIQARGEIELGDKNTVLAITEGRGADAINNGVAVREGAIGTPRRDESLSTGLTSVSVTQILTPRLVAGVTYDFMDLHGYQANIYRVVFGGAAPVPERVPDLRLRHAVAGSVRGYLPPVRATLIGAYRFYVDDWGIVAHTPEARLVQEPVPGLEWRVRYRYYTQTAADFFQETYTQAEIEDETRFVTDDEKLSAFETHTFGLQVIAALGLVGIEGTWGQVRLDATVERVLQDTAFGDAWVAHVGLVLPFAY